MLAELGNNYFEFRKVTTRDFRPGFFLGAWVKNPAGRMVHMIKTATGSIFHANVDALVNPVNCVGVMGAGLALAFKQNFPKMFGWYQLKCAEGEVKIGEVMFYHTDGPIIVNFPTKHHWKDPSRIEYIETGLKDLRRAITTSHTSDFHIPITSIAIPALGCGLGGLEWNEVKPLIVDSLADLGIRVELFEPQP